MTILVSSLFLLYRVTYDHEWIHVLETNGGRDQRNLQARLIIVNSGAIGGMTATVASPEM